MKLYLNIASNKIIGIDTEKINDYDKEIEAVSIEELENIAFSMSLEIDESLEQSLGELFNEEIVDENKFVIKHWVSNRSIGELIDMYDSGEIVKPTMQRNLVWDSIKCSRLIESILIGLPIPPLFMIEIDNSKYELVDGLQRINSFTNYIYGYSWSGSKDTKRPCRLSSHVMKDIAGKTFKELSEDYQRILRRSTIPLIEFKQLEPNNNEAKYLIFERINTGSVKLTAMQIRKSLAYGDFMASLYDLANSNIKFVSLFTNTNIKKDAHVEALLRIIAITEIYDSKYETRETNIGKILNTYCEERRNKPIAEDYINKFNNAIDTLMALYSDKNSICRKVMPKKGIPTYIGGLQITILESIVGTIIKYDIKNFNSFEEKYKKKMLDVYEKMVISMDLAENPFSYSTGTRDSINKRYHICEDILL